MDVACSLALWGLLLVLTVAYMVRLVRVGRAHHARVDQEGESAIGGKGAMEMFYWGLGPIAAALVRLRVGANAVTWASLALGLAASVALGMAHLGVGALLAALSLSGDALDGLVARHSHTASDAGEVLDASVDRYVELAFLSGLAVHFASSVVALLLSLGALGGSFMVSYSTAKAEALHVIPPRGSMRRAERAVLLIVGTALAPIVSLVPLLSRVPVMGVRGPWADVPLFVVLGLIAVLGNASAVRRLSFIAAVLRSRACHTNLPVHATARASTDVR